MKKAMNCQDTSRYQIVAICHPSDYAGGEVVIRPEEGQIVDSKLNVACAWALRKCLTPGCRLRLWVRYVHPKRGRAYLYSHPSWHFEILSDADIGCERSRCSMGLDEKRNVPKVKVHRRATWC